MLSPDQIEHQQRLLAEHRRTLAHLLSQQAKFSAGHIPAHMAIGIAESRASIAQIKTTLRAHHIIVEDHPDDEQSTGTFVPQHPSLISSLILFITVLSATAGAFVIADRLTGSFWWSLGTAAITLVGIFVVGALTEIWQRLKAPWLDGAARWVDGTLRRLFSRYHRKYLRFMEEQHRFFDVKGLTTQGPYSLMLYQVFVDLSLAPQPAHQVGADPIRAVPEALRAGQHSIWSFLGAKQMHGQHLAILGAPGSGKTTLLRHIALVLATSQRPAGISIARRVPILLFLRDHGAAIVANPQLSLATVIHDHLTRNEGPQPPPSWFGRQLAAGKCVVMLDGLDEVAELLQRQQVVQWVERQLVAHATNRFIITSRPFGFQTTPLERVTVLEVRPFTRAQIERFVNNWYLANEIMSTQRDDAGVRRDAHFGAQDLLNRLRNTQDLADLAVNPLLLTMIANVHRYSNSLPERRVELYREICTVFLGKRQQARGIVQDLTPAQKQLVLQTLAYAMMIRQSREIALNDALSLIREPLERISIGLTGEQFLKQIEESSGLLLEREHQRYSFAHLTFQEYLVATHILEQKREQVLISNVGESWWHETIRLYVAQTNATHILAACILKAGTSIPALSLAIDCSEEAREIAPAVRARFETVLAQGVEANDPERRRLVAEALLARRLRRMVRLDEQRAIDTFLISNAEYQLFLDESALQGADHQPDHWKEPRFPAGQGRAPVLGLRPSDATSFCNWLTQRSSGGLSYRLPQLNELPRDSDGTVQFAAQSAQLSCWLADTPEALIHLTSIRPESFHGQIEQRIEQDIAYLEARLARSFSTLALALADELASASSLSSDLIRAIDRASARNHNLTGSGKRARELDLASIRNRARAIELASTSATDRANDLARNLAHYLAHDRASVGTRAADLASISARDSASASALSRALTRILPNSRERIHARTLFQPLTNARANARALADTYARANARASDLVNALDLARARPTLTNRYHHRIKNEHETFVLERWSALNPSLDPHRDVVRVTRRAEPSSDGEAGPNLIKHISELSLGQALVIGCKRNSTIDPAQSADIATARLAIRCIALVVLNELELNRSNPSLIQWMLRRDDDSHRKMQNMIDTYADLYITFAILEERIAGNLQPCEGLLLVCELARPETEMERLQHL